MLCIVKTHKWLQKDYLINEHGHGDTCQSYNFSVDLCLSILSDHTEDFHFLLFPTNFHMHLIEILIFTVITFCHRSKKKTYTQSALFSLFLLKFVFVINYLFNCSAICLFSFISCLYSIHCFVLHRFVLSVRSVAMGILGGN